MLEPQVLNSDGSVKEYGVNGTYSTIQSAINATAEGTGATGAFTVA